MDILDRRRVYIMPTRPGLAMFVVIGMVLVGAVNYDNALAYILCFLLVALMLSAMLRTWRNLKGLGIEVRDAAPVHVGAPVTFEIALCDPGGLRRYAFTLRRLVTRWRFWWWRPREEGAGECVEVLGGRGTGALLVPTVRRGWLEIGRVEVASSFPIGMFRTWGYFKPGVRGLVYPAAVGQLPLPGEGEAASNDSGSVGPGVDDFAGLRNYQPGDSLRSVHWKASARSDDLFVKQLQGGGRGELLLRWQDTQGLGEPEARISQLASWVLQADRAGLRYGLVLPRLELPPAEGPVQRERCLRELALMSA